jgi:hypothetical protein
VLFYRTKVKNLPEEYRAYVDARKATNDPLAKKLRLLSYNDVYQPSGGSYPQKSCWAKIGLV